MNKLFDKLPYDDLDGVKFIHMLAGAAGAGLVLFIAYFFTLYSATSTEFDELSKQKKEAQRTLKRYQSKVAQEDQVAKNLARVKGRFDAFKNQMPRQAEIPGLMRQITAFAKDKNIKMVALTLEEGEVGSFYKEIPLKIQVQGELWVTLDFIEYMQNLLRLVNLNNLVLRGPDADISRRRAGRTAFGSLSTTLTVTTYSFLEGAENRMPEKKAPPEKKEEKKGH